MHRTLARIGLISLTLFASGVSASPEDQGLDPFIEELLALKAPARDWQAISKATKQPKPKIDRLAQLRTQAAEKPEDIADRLSDVQPDETTLRVVAEVSESDPDKQRFDTEWHNKVDTWLATWRRRLLPTYRAKLVQAARALNRDENAMVGSEDLNALAEADWPLAQSVLSDLRRSRDTRVQTYATCYLYKRGAGDDRIELREDLMRVAARRDGPGYARQLALETLCESPWPGRDQWFLSLFEDPTLLALRDGHYLYRPLNRFVSKDPDRWIPVVAKMLNGPSRAAHNNAVTALVQYHLRQKRADALRPLIPWLTDPSWSSADDRLRLLQSLEDLDIPESVPGLMSVIANEDGWPLRAAASAIGRYRATEAIPVLRAALLRKTHSMQGYVHRALEASGGLDVEARAVAREAHALRLEIEARVPEQARKPTSEVARLGAYLATQGQPSVPVSRVLLKRAQALEATHGPAAATLRAWVGPWPREDADAALLRKLGNGSADAKSLAQALGDRESIAAQFRGALTKLIDQGGIPSGCAAFLLGESTVINEILSGEDREAQMGLLACARVIRYEFNFSDLKHLLNSKHPVVQRVADAYLLAFDTPEARQTYLSRHPGEARLVGVAGYHTQKWEERLREEVLEKDGPQEVIALLSHGAWGPAGQVVIRVAEGRSTVTLHHRRNEDREQELSQRRLDDVMKYFEDIEADSLPAYQPAIYDGVHYTFVRFTRNGGYRIYMNNPGAWRSEKTEDVYARLARFMSTQVWQEE